MVCRPVVVLRDNLLFWFVLIMWSEWVQWQYKRRSGRVNKNYPIRNNYFIHWTLKKLIIILNYLNSKPVFFKTISKSIIIHNTKGKLCISTVWCSKESYRCWHFQTTISNSWCDLEKGHNSDNSKVPRSGQKVERNARISKCLCLWAVLQEGWYRVYKWAAK